MMRSKKSSDQRNTQMWCKSSLREWQHCLLKIVVQLSGGLDDISCNIKGLTRIQSLKSFHSKDLANRNITIIYTIIILVNINEHVYLFCLKYWHFRKV